MDKYKQHKLQYKYNRYSEFYMCDFETTKNVDDENSALVWLWDICDSRYNHYTGCDIVDFFGFFQKHCVGNNVALGFHDLIFDGAFVLDFLLTHGFTAVTHSDDLDVCEMYCLITPSNQHYMYHVRVATNLYLTFIDTSKTIPDTLEHMAEMFDFPARAVDVEIDRTVALHDPTPDELYNIQYNTQIVYHCLKKMWGDRYCQITRASQVFRSYKKLIGFNNYNAYFSRDFSCKYARAAYHGGFNYCKMLYKNRVLYGLKSYDINSMYPSIMLHAPLPYGEGVYHEGDCREFAGDGDVFIQKINVCFEIKKKGVPTMFNPVFTFENNPYMTSTSGLYREFILTSVDLELLFLNYYVIDIEYIDGYVYRTRAGYTPTNEEREALSYDEYVKLDGKGSFFYEYIKKWRRIKENSTGYMRELAKSMQNVLYGNFGKLIDGRMRVPYLDERDGLVKTKIEKSETESHEYVEMAAFITAWGRHKLVTDILNNIDRFVYCDTDSIYLLDDDEPPKLEMDETRYGYYKIEKEMERAYFVGNKRYAFVGYVCRDPECTKREYIVCAGAPPEIRAQMNFNNFRRGATFEGKRFVKLVQGGKYIIKTEFTLTEDIIF